MNFLTTLALSCLLAIVVAPQSSHAQNASSQLEYRESDIGIDYRAIAEPPLDVLLSHGEVEFLENATPVHGDMAVDSWPDFASEIAGGNVSEFTIDIMREFTPNMLSAFSRIPAEAIKYRSLGIIGLEFNSERFLEAVEE